jgi:4-amino-4-deoxy-L-arabinose transferase-like glycosyltransferase
MKKLYRKWKSEFIRQITIEPFSAKFQYTCLAIILLFTVAVRLVSIDAPALDRTMWKEIDYIAISSNFWQNGFNFLSPEIFWPAEPPRTTAMELPLVPYMAAILYSLFGFNVITVRLIPLLSFLLLSVYVFRLAKRELNSMVGLIASLAASIFPLYNQFGNILFSEPLMITMSVAAVFHFAQWMDSGRMNDCILSGTSFSLAVALKLTPLYLLLPLTWLAYRKFGLTLKNYIKLLILLLLSLLLPIAWYAYAYYLTFNSIDVFGIFHGHDKMQTATMLADPSWYTTMLFRIGGNILGGKFSSLFCLIGFLSGLTYLKKTNLFYAYALMITIFFVIVAEGQIDAPYRQHTAIPFLAVFLALGTVSFLSFFKSVWQPANPLTSKRQKLFPQKLLLICSGLVIAILVFNFAKVFNRDPLVPSDPIRWELSEQIKMYASPEAKLIAAGEYTIHKGGNDLSPVLYHYSGLRGWTIEADGWNPKTIDRFIQKGATLFAATQMSRQAESEPFIKSMRQRYPSLYENSSREILLLDLTSPILSEKQ